MKTKFRLWVNIFISFVFLSYPELISGQELSFPTTEVTISMDFQDARLKDVLKVFSIQSGLNFIASEAVQDRTITLYFDKVPIKEAMDKIFKANNLSYELDKDSNIFIVKDWGRPGIETVTKVFYLKYATVSSSSLKEEMAKQITVIKEVGAEGGGGGGGGGGAGEGKWKIEGDTGITIVVKKLLSENGSLVEDFRTNSLIVTDIPSRIPIIAKAITALDVPVPQIMLEVEMLDVSKNVVDKLGFEFGESPITLILPGGFIRRGAEFFVGTLADRKKDIASLAVEGKAVLGATFAQVLDFLRTQTDTKYLARPRLLTLNNETAEIKIATQEVIGEKVAYDDQGNITSREAERTETGVILRVSPQINVETGEITMFLNPKVIEASTSAFSSSYRDPEERATKSIVKIKDGETVIIGGLIRNDFLQTITKIPILGDIPILGNLFRHKNKSKDKERELLVFITPRIVRDTDIKLSQRKKEISLPEREQNSISGIDRQAIINNSLNSFEKKKK